MSGGVPLGAGRLGDLCDRLDGVLSGLPEDVRPDPAGNDPHLVLAVVDVWTELFGGSSFELFGRYRNVVEVRAERLDASAVRTALAAGVVTAAEVAAAAEADVVGG